MNATEKFNQLIDSHADDILPNDKLTLEAAAIAVLMEAGLSTRIGDPQPIADACLDVLHDADSWISDDDGNFMARFGRVIITSDSNGFRTSELHWGTEAARATYNAYLEFYPQDDES